MNWGEISSTLHYWYYLDLLLERRFIHILNNVVLKMAESMQDRPKFYNSTRGAKKWHSKEATVKRAIQQERRKKIPEPPKSLSDLEIPNHILLVV